MDPFVFPTTHWIPRGKIFDSYEDAENRGCEMLEALRGYTAADVKSILERLTLVPNDSDKDALSKSGNLSTSTSSFSGEDV